MQKSISHNQWKRIIVLIINMLVLFCFLFILNIHISKAKYNGELTALQAQTSEVEWMIQCVDCPKATPNIGEKGLRLDTNNQPHIAYGGDSLYYAYLDGSTWHHQIVDQETSVDHVSLALNQYNQPHISYYAEGLLKHAFYNGYNWEISTIDDTGSFTGYYSSIAVDDRGNPHISYSDYDWLKHAYFDGENWHITKLTQIVGTLTSTSIALNANGNPFIAYSWHYAPAEFPSPGVVDSKIELASFNGNAWQFETIEQHSYIKFLHASLELDQSNQPHIGYSLGGTVKYATKTQNAWQTEVIEMFGSEAKAVSLSLDSADTPHIIYLPPFSSARYAVRINNSWQTGNVGYYAAAVFANIVVDTLGNPHVIYFHSQPRYLTYAYKNGGQWHLGVVEEFPEIGDEHDIAVSKENDIHVSYHYETNNHLKYAILEGDSWQIETIDTGGEYTSISLALDQNGYPHIAYIAIESNYGYFKYAFFDGEKWQVTYISSNPFALSGGSIDLALDSNDSPHLTIGGSDNLYYVLQNGTDWQISNVDAENSNPSIAIDKNGNPNIAYIKGKELRLAQFKAQSWQIETIDTSDHAGFPSLKIDELNHPHISYRTVTGLHYAYNDGSQWLIENIVPIDSGFIDYSPLQLDTSNHPHISYIRDDYLSYIWSDGFKWSTEIVVEGVRTTKPGLALDSFDHPHISYIDDHAYTHKGNNLKLATFKPPSFDLKIVPSQSSNLLYGDEITLTLVLSGAGLDTTLSHPLHENLTFVEGSLAPPAQYISATHEIKWQGQLPLDMPTLIEYRVQLQNSDNLAIANSQADTIILNAWLTDNSFGRQTKATIYINGYHHYFPLTYK